MVSNGSKQVCCALGGSCYHWLERLFPCSVCSLTYNPPHCLVLKLFIGRQPYLLRLMDMGRPVTDGVDLFLVPPCLNRPASRSFLRRRHSCFAWSTLLNCFSESGRRGGAFAIYDSDETRTEGSGPFSLVISFTTFGLARSMRSFSEVLGSRTPQWYAPFLLRLPSDLFISPPSARRGSIKPKRTSWRIDGIGRRLEDRAGGVAYLH